MRGIKFRAWDKTRNIYGEVLGIYRPYGENGSQFPEGHKGRLSLFNIKNEYDCRFWGILIEEADLEQYAGLMDKNGREIYEGDFVRDARYTMRVLWSETHASFCLGRPEWAFLHFFHEAVEANRCEVIGNIHENPDLLEQS